VITISAEGGGSGGGGFTFPTQIFQVGPGTATVNAAAEKTTVIQATTDGADYAVNIEISALTPNTVHYIVAEQINIQSQRTLSWIFKWDGTQIASSGSSRDIFKVFIFNSEISDSPGTNRLIIAIERATSLAAAIVNRPYTV
jgi:hypothetical protein